MTKDQIQKVREEHARAPRMSADNTHVAVIVETSASRHRKWAGVQYWSESEIFVGKRLNSDHTASKFIERL